MSGPARAGKECGASCQRRVGWRRRSDRPDVERTPAGISASPPSSGEAGFFAPIRVASARGNERVALPQRARQKRDAAFLADGFGDEHGVGIGKAGVQRGCSARASHCSAAAPGTVMNDPLLIKGQGFAQSAPAPADRAVRAEGLR